MSTTSHSGAAPGRSARRSEIRAEGRYDDRLREIARRTANGDEAGAERDLRLLLAEVEGRGDPDAVGCYVFGAALASRLSRGLSREANLYLQKFDVPQIHLFNLLASEVPIVGLAGPVANQCLARAVAGQKHATIIDIGIGTGRQMTALLELVSTGDRPETITIIGIEPAESSLDLAAANLAAAAARLGLDVRFERICSVAEGLTRQDWLRLATLCRTRPAINASFALHHMSDVDGRDVRDDVLLRLRSLSPRALVLSEPNVHHLEPDFRLRFDNCLRHFGAVFGLIDELAITQADRNALKVCFFGREISDILGAADAVRSERHESTASWLGRLTRSGYEASIDVALPDPGPVVEIHPRAGHLSIEFGSEPLVSIIHATPAEGTFDVQGAFDRAPSERVHQPASAPFDVHYYLAALSAVARADTVLHAEEREFIADQARVLGVGPGEWQTSTVEDVIRRAGSVSRRTREAIVRDLVFLARVDDHYDATERVAVAAIARSLGLTDAERSALEVDAKPPPLLSGAPSWLRWLWFLGSKEGSTTNP